MTWKGRKKYKKCIIKKKKTYIILRQGIMPLHMLFLFFSFKKKKIKKFSKSEKFWFCIHANINHASAHCSPKNEGMRAHIVVKNNDFKDFYFFFTAVSKRTFSTPHPTKACYFLCVCFCVFMLFVGLQFSRCLNSLMAREFGHSYQSGNTLSVPSVLISEWFTPQWSVESTEDNLSTFILHHQIQFSCHAGNCVIFTGATLPRWNLS